MPDEPVFEVGDRMDGFYVLIEGAVSAEIDGRSVWGSARSNTREYAPRLHSTQF